MDAVELATVVYLPPTDVHDFLLEFERYPNYSKYLTDVRVSGDGGPGTEYALTFSWWKLSYTARSRVTAVEPPSRIDWELTKDVDAAGYWQVEPVEPPAGREHASEVTFRVEFRPETADASSLDLPTFVSLDWVIEKVTPKIQAEAERVVRRIVADLEGEHRPVDLEIRTAPDSV